MAFLTDPQEIINWIRKYAMPTVISDISDQGVTIDGDFKLNTKALRRVPGNTFSIPVQFYHVTGKFEISDNTFNPLPKELSISTLEGSPRIVGDDFVAMNCGLTSLVGGPDSVGGYFNVAYNPNLTSLAHSPETCGRLIGSDCNLKTLDCANTTVKFGFSIVGNKNLKNLQGLPTTIGRSLHAYPLNSLQGIAGASVQRLYINYRPDLGLLNIPRIKNLQGVHFIEIEKYEYENLEAILKRYFNAGMSSVLPLAAELIKAGFKGNAHF